MQIGFIGLGTMGRYMVANLLKAGHELTLHTRTREKALALLAQGARWADNAGAAAMTAECIVTMLGTPADVEHVYFGGVLDNAPRGALLIDMTTSSPKLAVRIHAAALARGADALDAPVTGGPQGAESGTLTIMAGGAETVFERARPVLRAMGSTLVYFGAPGNGQRAKLVNQIVAMQNALGAIEGLFFSRKAGLDGEATLQMLQSGLADSKSLRGLATRGFRGDFSPNFHPAHLVKDLTIAIEEADSLGLDLPGLRNAKARWQEVLRRFPEARSIQDVARLYV